MFWDGSLFTECPLSLPTKYCRGNYRLIISDILKGNVRIVPTVPNILQWKQTLHVTAVAVGLKLCCYSGGKIIQQPTLLRRVMPAFDLKLLTFPRRFDK